MKFRGSATFKVGALTAVLGDNEAYDVMKEYGFKVHTVFRPRCTRAAVGEEFQK